MELPNFYAILEATVRYDPELSFFEKVLYAEITALANKFSYCYAKNSYFEKVFDKSKRTIQRGISNLEQRGYINIQFVEQERRLFVNARMYEFLKNHPHLDMRGDKFDMGGYDKNDIGGMTKMSPINNININNTSKNINDNIAHARTYPHFKTDDEIEEDKKHLKEFYDSFMQK